MTGTLLHMPKKQTKPKYPSREKLKYVGIPREYWVIFEALTADGEKYEGRSVAYLTKIAVRAWLHAEGKMDAKGKPIS